MLLEALNTAGSAANRAARIVAEVEVSSQVNGLKTPVAAVAGGPLSAPPADTGE